MNEDLKARIDWLKIKARFLTGDAIGKEMAIRSKEGKHETVVRGKIVKCEVAENPRIAGQTITALFNVTLETKTGARFDYTVKVLPR